MIHSEAPEGYELSIGADNFIKILQQYGGQEAVDDWTKLSQTLRPMSRGIMGLPSTAIRGDAGVLLTIGAKYPKEFFNVIRFASQITEPFDLEKLGVKSPFLKNYLDMICGTGCATIIQRQTAGDCFLSQQQQPSLCYKLYVTTTAPISPSLVGRRCSSFVTNTSLGKSYLYQTFGMG